MRLVSLEQRLQAFYAEATEGQTAPSSLRASVADVPYVMRSRFAFRFSPAWALLFLLGLLVALAAGAIATGALRLSGEAVPKEEVLVSVSDRIVAVDVRTGAHRDLAAGTIIAISPDRRFFLRSITTVSNGSVSYQCFVTRADGVDERTLDACGGGNSNTAAISPYGAKALFYDGGFFIADLATGHVTRLPWRESFKDTGTGTWSPDGQMIVIPAKGELVIADGNGQLVGTIPTSGPSFAPTWSPDGRNIAYMSLSRWAVVHAEIGGDQFGREVISRAGGSPTWSPNGRQIAYIAGNMLRVVDSDGRNDRLLDNAGLHSPGPKWSPDGAQILYWKVSAFGTPDVHGPMVVIQLSNGTSRSVYPTGSFYFAW
jgi:WD40-like Beta Propeller Repeat